MEVWYKEIVCYFSWNNSGWLYKCFPQYLSFLSADLSFLTSRECTVWHWPDQSKISFTNYSVCVQTFYGISLIWLWDKSWREKKMGWGVVIKLKLLHTTPNLYFIIYIKNLDVYKIHTGGVNPQKCPSNNRGSTGTQKKLELIAWARKHPSQEA